MGQNLLYVRLRIHGVPGATYETASTRQFLHGRTETIRSVSLESTQFCRCMLDNEANAEQKRDALHKAIAAHKQYVFEVIINNLSDHFDNYSACLSFSSCVKAVKGFGVDRHLLGLKLTAIEKGWDIPAIYKDVAFAKSSHFRISSSQVMRNANLVNKN